VENATTTLTADCALPVSVGPGENMSLSCTLSDGEALPGRVYTVKLITYGGVYTYDVRARGGATPSG
ncbi:MAG: hypothetical protein QW820_07760, partial [Sulfolobales archaeon]